MVADVSIILLVTFTVILLVLVILSWKNLNKLKIRNLEIENLNALQKTFNDADESQIYLKDQNLKYLFVNQAFRKFHNKSDQEIVGFDDFSLTEDAFAQKRRKTDIDVLEKQTLINDEIEWKDNVYKITKFPVSLIDGAIGVGAQVRDITEEYNNKRTLQKTLQRNSILIDVLNRGFQTTTEQLDYVLHEALKLTESKLGYIYLYDEDKEEFTLNTWSCDVMSECMIIEQQSIYYLKNTGIWGEAVRQKKPIVVNNFEASNPLKKGYPEGHVKLKKFMTIPVMVDERIVAVVGLANKEYNYDDNDIYQITVLMSGVWNAKERREALEKLSYERNKYLQTIISIGDGVMVVDRAGRIEMLNTEAQRMTGWLLEDAQGIHYRQVFKISHEQNGHCINDPIQGVLQTNAYQELESYAVLTSKDGKQYALEDSAAPILDECGNTVGVVLVFRDVSEKNQQRREIEFLSFHDPLTGLYNRRFFEEEMLRLNREENMPISIIMGDVNGLKLTNDVYGHAYGDMLLKKISEVLRDACRQKDVIARFGGDEFGILLPKTTREEAAELICKIKSQFQMEQVRAIKGSISMGSGIKQNMDQHMLQALEDAEEQMYISKTLERKRVGSAIISEVVQTLHRNSKNEKEHAVRVSNLCMDFGRALNMPVDELRKLKDAGFFHDIGKIVLEQHIFNSAHMLTRQEWDAVKRHPIIGYRILNAFDETLGLAEPVLAHHEWWDGSGYPKGLKGEEIPVIARIIALVEAYDRMANNPKKTADEARVWAKEMIRKNSGYQFDPEIAAKFLSFIESNVFDSII